MHGGRGQGKRAECMDHSQMSFFPVNGKNRDARGARKMYYDLKSDAPSAQMCCDI